MSENRAAFLATPTGARIDGRFIAVAFFLAVLVFEFALVRFAGPIGTSAHDTEIVLVGP